MFEFNGYDALFAILALSLSVWHRFFIMKKMKAFRPVLTLIAARCEQQGIVGVESEIQRMLGSAWTSLKFQVVGCYGGMFLYVFLFAQAHDCMSPLFVGASHVMEVFGLVFCLVKAVIDPSSLEGE